MQLRYCVVSSSCIPMASCTGEFTSFFKIFYPPLPPSIYLCVIQFLFLLIPSLLYDLIFSCLDPTLLPYDMNSAVLTQPCAVWHDFCCFDPISVLCGMMSAVLTQFLCCVAEISSWTMSCWTRMATSRSLTLACARRRSLVRIGPPPSVAHQTTLHQR